MSDWNSNKEEVIKNKENKDKHKSTLWKDLKTSDKDEILQALAERAGLVKKPE